jgi:copper oxidase (laccase) domain-containing protein
LDGQACVKQLKAWDYYWSHPEWPGFYVEAAGRRELVRYMRGNVGPTIGRTTYDYQNEFIWDLKTHSLNDMHGRSNQIILLNDTESIEAAANKYEGVGFVMLCATCNLTMTERFRSGRKASRAG